ncbi:hypothetical protein [Oceanithermus sp.]
MLKRLATLALLAAFVLVYSGCNQEAQPDFKIVPAQSSIQVHQGDSENVGMGIVPSGGFEGEVSIWARLSGGGDLPPGISLSPTAVTVSGQRLDFTLTISASSSAPVGDYSATLTFTSGSISHEIGFGISVVPPAGTLDASFGDAGVTVVADLTQVQGEDDLAYSLTFDGDGSIYLLGRSNDELVVSKLSGSGLADGSFAGTGVLQLGTLDSLANDTLDFDLDHALAWLPSGMLLATGYTVNTNQDLLLARFDQAGELDASFAGGGFVSYDNLAGGSGNDRGYSLLPSSSGFAVCGFSYQDTTEIEQLVLAEFSSDGDLITPRVTGITGGNSDYGYSLASNGAGYLCGGETASSSGRLGLLARFDSSLNLLETDTSDAFSGGRIKSVVPSGDGGYYAAGYAYNGSDYDLVIAKLLPDGSLDTSFGGNGYVSFDDIGGGGTPGSDRAFSLAVDADGRLLVAGRAFVAGDSDDLIVARLNPDGSLDEKFASGGVFVYDGGNGNDGAFELALDSSGKIVVVGYTTNADGDLDALALRLNP